MNICELNKLTNIDIKSYKQLTDKRLDKEYSVYCIKNKNNEQFILKNVLKNEVIMNQIFDKEQITYVPKVIGQIENIANNYWMTSEFVEGPDYTSISPVQAMELGSALSNLTNYFFIKSELLENVISNIETQLRYKDLILSKINKNTWLYDCYKLHIERFNEIPKSICHDDLLPINIIYDKKKHEPKIIDWEHGRKGSYVTDIARVSVFYSEDIDLFKKGFSFFGKNSTIELLIDTYSRGIASEMGISKKQFIVDYQLECLNQLLLNINYLDNFDKSNIKNEWEKYFYQLIEERLALISKI